MSAREDDAAESVNEVRISDSNTPLETLLLTMTSNEVVAYISGDQHEIIVIDNLGNRMRSINTVGWPSGLAPMADGSLIYSVYKTKTVYRVFSNEQSTKLIDAG